MAAVERLFQIWTICVLIFVGSLGRGEAALLDDIGNSNSDVAQAGQWRTISDPTTLVAMTRPLEDATKRVARALKRPGTWNEVAVGDLNPKDASSDGGAKEGPSIREIQRLLLQLGFDPGPIDGKLGRSTASAISSYQATAGLTVDGKPSRALLQRLREDAVNLTMSPASKSNEDPNPPRNESPTFSGEVDSEESQSTSLAGTTWLFNDESGSEFSLSFIQGGSVKGVLYENFWNWRQSGEDVEIFYDNSLGLTVYRAGVIRIPGIMEGTAVPSRGEEWTWKAKRTLPPVTSSEETMAVSIVAAEPVAAQTQPVDASVSKNDAPAPPDDDREATVAAGGQDPVAPDSNEKSASPNAQSQTEIDEHVPVVPSEREESAIIEQNIPGTDSSPASSTRPPKVNRPAGDERSLKEAYGGNTETSAREPRIYGSENEDSRIIVRALAESWVEVFDGEGDILFSRVLRKGDSYRVPVGQGASMVTGNAGGLEIIVDGQPVPALGPVGAVRRGVALDPESLK